MRLNRLLLLLAIVVPVIACVICLRALREINEEKEPEEKEKPASSSTVTTDNNGGMVEVPIYTNDTIEEAETKQTLGGVEFYSKIGNPTSIIYLDATVASVVANVYKEAREQPDEIIDTRTKYEVLKTAQKYPQGWTRVQTDKVSGWMRTENITFPDRKDGILDDSSLIGRTGKVISDVSLNVRASSSMDADVLTTVAPGTLLTIQDTADGWYKITYASTTGWVSAKYIEIQ